MTSFTKISYSDTGSIDAFSRLRTSAPEAILSIQTQYNNATIQMESGNTGTGVAPTYNTSTRMTALAVTAGSGTSFMQSYEYCPYQPGRSQFIAMTFVMGTGVAGATADVGYFDANNGVIFRQNGVTNLQLILRTATGGSPSDANIVNQSAWNIDTLLGSGPSGITLDVTKSQILVIDLQYLGMGRVRVGFDINGVIYYVHQFLNANNLAVPYMQAATLPVGILVTATSTATTKTMYFKCATVQTEGGALVEYGYHFSTPDLAITAGSGTRTPLVSIRPKTTFNGISNRELFIVETLSFLVNGSNPVYWELVVGGAFGGQAWADVNTSYSAFEYSSTPGTFTNLTGGLVLISGYVGASTAGTATIIPIELNQSLHHPITLDRAGAVRALGTLTLLGTGLTGTAPVRSVINFKEIR